MLNDPLPDLSVSAQLRAQLLPHCRLQRGEVWTDPVVGHRIGCLDCTDSAEVSTLMGAEKGVLAVQDPPYNLVMFERRTIEEYIEWCRKWIVNTEQSLTDDCALYIWLGADQKAGFQPLPDFILLMRETPFRSRSLITMRNQRGYGTQKNWMAVRQELLYYTKGSPHFDVQAEYTDIPKILRGYYKTVNGVRTDNLERGKSPNIRAGNVWVDIQQVFYRMEENVPGCYAQKPLSAISRIIRASSRVGDTVVDFFAHAGTTLIAAEQAGRRCFTMDIDPIFAELTIRRLEHYRETRKTGWQKSNPFPVTESTLTTANEQVVYD